MMKLRKIIFWSHLLAGVSAGLVIFSMSFTGVVLMYEPQITEYFERNVRRVKPPHENKRLTYDDLMARVRAANPEARLAMIMVKSDPRASVSVNLGRDNTLFVNPYNGEILGSESPTHRFLRDIVEWHRWLSVEGEGRATARAITGACNLAFFWLAVTGVYLWWPPSWHWRGLKHSFLFNPRLRGKARDWNWHNVIGFWSSSVLVVLTLTAAVMSYPWANDLLYTLTGSQPPRRAESPGSAGAERFPGRAQRSEARGGSPARFDILMARAQEQVPGWVMIMLRLPPRGDGPVTASIQGPDAFHPFQRSQLSLNR
ncbi:MAG TPA: PepSY-associated TM helix domain-containing protein, partial [Candidatus Binatia bacterium]